MPTAVTNSRAGADARSESLIALLERAGYPRLVPAVLQPAAPFLDLSGEDIRRRMYLTSDAQGQELCLRPDLTIPVCREYLASYAEGKPQGFSYLGQVFRQPLEQDVASEFWQAGIESFGRTDTAAADAEMLALGLEATARYGLQQPSIALGDIGLFAAVVAALDIAPTLKRRLIKHFNHRRFLAHDLDRIANEAGGTLPEYQGVLAALAGSDPHAARALVTDLLSIAGISTVGGRTVGEIADRFLEQATLGLGRSLPRDIPGLIERFLAVTGDPDQAAAALRAFARDCQLSIDASLDLFESRTGFLTARGIDVACIRFSTGFGRGLDYYTGFVFELHDPDRRLPGPLAAGGRYDGLLTRLGSPRAIPAVGFSVWIERLAALQDCP